MDLCVSRLALPSKIWDSFRVRILPLNIRVLGRNSIRSWDFLPVPINQTSSGLILRLEAHLPLRLKYRYLCLVEKITILISVFDTLITADYALLSNWQWSDGGIALVGQRDLCRRNGRGRVAEVGYLVRVLGVLFSISAEGHELGGGTYVSVERAAVKIPCLEDFHGLASILRPRIAVRQGRIHRERSNAKSQK